MADEAVLVSGGSGGIGRALCRRLAHVGYVPIIGYARSREIAEDVARECSGRALKLDLKNFNDIEVAVAGLISGGLNLTGVVLAASPPPRMEPLAQVSDEEMTQQWLVNVEGPRRLLAGLIRNIFRKNRRGVVVGVLSKAMGIGDEAAMSKMSAYIIAKYGMAGVLAVAAADYPWLRVHSVSPTFTETDMLNAFDQRFLELLRQKTRFQQPDEVAAEIVSILHSAAN